MTAPSPHEPRERAEWPRMRLVSWKALVKGTLRGFATVELPIELNLVDCPIFVGPNGPWAALPSKPVLDCEGRQARPSGKPQFAPVDEWRNRVWLTVSWRPLSRWSRARIQTCSVSARHERQVSRRTVRCTFPR